MILPRMPATCHHPHQTCTDSNGSYMKISCSSCGAVLFQNYMTQFDKDLFKWKFGVEEELAMEPIQACNLPTHPRHWEDHRSLAEILSSYVEQKESKEDSTAVPAPSTPPWKEAVGVVVPPGLHPDWWPHLNQVERNILIRLAEGKLAGPIEEVS